MDILWIIAIFLLAFWLLGNVFFIGGPFIHLLLVIAVMVVIVKLFRGR